MVINLPLPSTANVGFGAEVAWLRPNASVSGSPFCTGGMLMRTHDGACCIMDCPVQFPGLVGFCWTADAVPDLGLAPTLKPAVYRRPRPIPLRQIPPWRTRRRIHKSIQYAPVVCRQSSRPCFLWWQERLQPLPLLVC